MPTLILEILGQYACLHILNIHAFLFPAKQIQNVLFGNTLCLK